MCSKALAFVDYMYVPHAHPLIDGEDVIYYDPLDKQGFMDKVHYYLSQKDEGATRPFVIIDTSTAWTTS